MYLVLSQKTKYQAHPHLWKQITFRCDRRKRAKSMSRPKTTKPAESVRTTKFSYRFNHELAQYEVWIPCSVCGKQIKKPHEATIFFTLDGEAHGKSWTVHDQCVEEFRAKTAATLPELYEDTVANWLFGLLVSVKTTQVRKTHTNVLGERHAKVSLMVPDPVK